jgi:hypothetical protein
VRISSLLHNELARPLGVMRPLLYLMRQSDSKYAETKSVECVVLIYNLHCDELLVFLNFSLYVNIERPTDLSNVMVVFQHLWLNLVKG